MTLDELCALLKVPRRVFTGSPDPDLASTQIEKLLTERDDRLREKYQKAILDKWTMMTKAFPTPDELEPLTCICQTREKCERYGCLVCCTCGQQRRRRLRMVPTVTAEEFRGQIKLIAGMLDVLRLTAVPGVDGNVIDMAKSQLSYASEHLSDAHSYVNAAIEKDKK